MNQRNDADKDGSVEVTVGDEDIQTSLMVESRRFMRFALAGEVLFWVLLFGPGAESLWLALAMAAYAGAWVASVLGVSRGARAVGMNPVLRMVFYVLSFALVFRLIPIAYFLGRSQHVRGHSDERTRREQGIEAARQRARDRQQARAQAPAPAPAGAQTAVPPVASGTSGQTARLSADAQADPAARARVSSAIPRIRVVRSGLKEGERIKLALQLPPGVSVPDLSQVVMPVTRASMGIFGLNYMVDDGEQYTSIDESDLETSGFSLDELHQLAMKNLRRLVVQTGSGPKLRRLQAVDGSGEAIRLMLDGNNEAALLLIDELWDTALKKHTPNGVMAVAPARDVCVFIDMASVTNGGLGDLQSVVAKVHQQQGHAFNGLLHRVDGRWIIGGEVNGLPGGQAA